MSNDSSIPKLPLLTRFVQDVKRWSEQYVACTDPYQKKKSYHQLQRKIRGISSETKLRDCIQFAVAHQIYRRFRSKELFLYALILTTFPHSMDKNAEQDHINSVLYEHEREFMKRFYIIPSPSSQQKHHRSAIVRYVAHDVSIYKLWNMMTKYNIPFCFRKKTEIIEMLLLLWFRPRWSFVFDTIFVTIPTSSSSSLLSPSFPPLPYLVGNPKDILCPICLEIVDSGNNYRMPCSCTNFYHKQCLITWVSKNPSCPTCRKRGD